MYKKSDKRGFTMAEMLVCLAIISVIATILIPTLGRVKPHKEKTMFKKSYQVAERVIYELVNDPELYPTTDINAGFDNVKKVKYNGLEYGDDDTNSDSAKAKFCQLFALKVNTLDEATRCDSDENFLVKDFKDYERLAKFSEITYNDIKPSFTTTDGVVWYMPYTNFEADGAYDEQKFYHPIFIDVNGPKPPNQPDVYISEPSTSVDKCTKDMQTQIDRFVILVRADGKMEVPGVCARAYLQDMSLMHKAK